MNTPIPGYEESLEIHTLILDLNGTITEDGILIEGVKERINAIREKAIRIFLFTGDTLGTGAKIAQELGLEFRLTKTSQAKADETKKLNPETAATIGNGRIDLELFKTVRFRICVIQAEGAYTETLLNSDVVMNSINDALDFFLKPNRMIGTLRK